MPAKQVSSEDYKRLKELTFQSIDQENDYYRDWPFPLLFQGERFSRDIFFLDPLIEYEGLPLGKNPVQDWSYPRYRWLWSWFHYVFFFRGGSGWCGCSAEKETLLPRLYRLASALISADETQVADWYKREHGIESGRYLLPVFRSEINRMISITSENSLIVWGVEDQTGALELQKNYIKEILSVIRTDLAWKLPHLSWMHHVWTGSLKQELKAYRRAEAAFNKRLKIQKRSSVKR